jgi:hypothetical protein
MPLNALGVSQCSYLYVLIFTSSYIFYLYVLIFTSSYIFYLYVLFVCSHLKLSKLKLTFRGITQIHTKFRPEKFCDVPP